jgi:hypothetical protein
MVTFMFAGASVTAMLMNQLSSEHHWRVWTGSFDEVLPYLQDGFSRVMEEFSAEITAGELREELTELVRQLCNPDPAVRGDTKNRARGLNPFSLERYLTRFDVLSRKASVGAFRSSGAI